MIDLAAAISQSNPAAVALISPALLFVLSLIGAAAMILMLPGRKERALAHIGAAVLLAVLIIAGAQAGRQAARISVYFWIFSGIALIAAVRVITHTKPVYSALYFVMTVMASAGLFVLMWAEFMAAALILIYAGAILITYIFVIMLAAEATPQAGGVAHEAEHDAISREPVLASAVGFALMGVMLFVIFDKPPGRPANAPPAQLAQSDVSAALSLLTRTTIPGAQPTYETPASHGASDKFGGTMRLSATQPSHLSWEIAAQHVPPSAIKTSGAGGATQQLGEYLFSTEVVNLELAGLILTVAMVGAIVIARRQVWRSAAAAEARQEMISAPMTPMDDNPHSIAVYGTSDPRQKAYPET
jgi:NADH-quinone oxidoreductase subunit J